jgi:hypothetical protein
MRRVVAAAAATESQSPQNLQLALQKRKDMIEDKPKEVRRLALACICRRHQAPRKPRQQGSLVRSLVGAQIENMCSEREAVRNEPDEFIVISARSPGSSE